MNWSDAISEGLPSPRDDEPATLRQDLVDELNDHLQSALQRELRAVPDVEQARRNVLARFGDPRRVLYKLWYQAMKEQIMSQRLMLILGAVMAATCLAAAGMTWWLVQQSQSTQVALLDKIAVLAAPQANASNLPSAEWGAVKVKLTSDDEKKSPAVGFCVRLSGKLFKEGQYESFDVVSDSDGIADFGSVRIGWQTVNVTSPTQETYRDSILARPGQDVQLHVQCPVPPPEAAVTFDLTLPEDLREQRPWTACSLMAQPRMAGGKKWSRVSYSIIFDAQGRIVFSGHPIESGQEWWDESTTTPPSERTTTVRLPALEYTIEGLGICKPSSDSKAQLLKYAIESSLGGTEKGDFGKVVPVPGRSSRYVIQLPEKLIDDVRKKLAEPAEPTEPSDAGAPAGDSSKSQRVD